MNSVKNKISANLRHEAILETLRAEREVSIPDLAQHFAISEMTVRRDLDLLAERGFVRRTHGGATVGERMAFEFDFVERRNRNQKAKRAIAAAAVKLIKPEQRIILDSGTTTLELSYLLREFRDLTVITTSLAVAAVLQFAAGVETILLGGTIRKGSPDLTGTVTEQVLEMFMVDTLFQGADGISLEGELFNADERIANVDRKMRQRAGNTYILCDSSKIGRTDFASNGNLSEVTALLTDTGLNREIFTGLSRKCANIVMCQL